MLMKNYEHSFFAKLPKVDPIAVFVRMTIAQSNKRMIINGFQRNG